MLPSALKAPVETLLQVLAELRHQRCRGRWVDDTVGIQLRAQLQCGLEHGIGGGGDPPPGLSLYLSSIWSLCWPRCLSPQEGSFYLMSPQEKIRGNLLSHTKKEKGGQKMEFTVVGSRVPGVIEMSPWAGSHQKSRA